MKISKPFGHQATVERMASYDYSEHVGHKGFFTPRRECDDPHLNFLKIRDWRLWEALEEKQRNAQ